MATWRSSEFGPLGGAIRPRSARAAGSAAALVLALVLSSAAAGQRAAAAEGTPAERARPGDPGGAGPTADSPSPHDARPAFHGEHGLWIRTEGRRLEIRWITRSTGRGFLVAVADGDTLKDASTPRSILHAAGVRVPRRAEAVTLRYGAREDPGDRHETTVRLPLSPPPAPWSLDGVDSLFVVGDVHGRFDTLAELLRNAGLVGDDLGWTGGRSHLVLLGDVFDRGPDVTRTLWFLYELEDDARAAGGGAHFVLGNHELMVLTDDLRYVSEKERALADLHGVDYPRLFDVRNTVLGRWLAARPAVLRVDDVLLAHGGVGPAYRDWPVEALNDSATAYMAEDLFRRWSDSTVSVAPMDSVALWRRIDFFTSPASVFWYRGYLPAGADGGGPGGAGAATAGPPPDAGGAGEAPGELLERMLEARGASLHVVAHTPLDRVRAFHDGRLVGVDLHRPASELLLLVRSGNGWDRFRWGLDGGPVPLETAGGDPP